MRGTKNRNIKILGGTWLVGGGLFFAVALFAITQVIIDPSGAEDGFLGGAVFVLILLVLGAIFSVNGFALLRRNPVARPLIAISSLVLFIPSVAGRLLASASLPCWSWGPAYGLRCQEVARRRSRATWQERMDEKVVAMLATLQPA